MFLKAIKRCLWVVGVVGGLEPSLRTIFEQVSDHQKSTQNGSKIGFFKVSRTACTDVIWCLEIFRVPRCVFKLLKGDLALQNSRSVWLDCPNRHQRWSRIMSETQFSGAVESLSATYVWNASKGLAPFELIASEINITAETSVHSLTEVIWRISRGIRWDTSRGIHVLVFLSVVDFLLRH